MSLSFRPNHVELYCLSLFPLTEVLCPTHHQQVSTLLIYMMFFLRVAASCLICIVHVCTPFYHCYWVFNVVYGTKLSTCFVFALMKSRRPR